MARSVRSTKRGDLLEFVRQYPQGRRHGMVTGFYSLVYGRTLAEQEFNSFLLGRAPEQFGQNVTDLLTARETPGGTLVLTLDEATQAAAEGALRGQRQGAVVALDPRTGAVLAMTTFSRQRPQRPVQPQAGGDPAQLGAPGRRPQRAAAEPGRRGAHPPGSTFKVVTAAALENGVTMDEERLPGRLRRALDSADIRNFGGSGAATLTLTEALEISCNTTFAAPGRAAREAGRRGGEVRPNKPSPYQLRRPPVSSPDRTCRHTAQSAIGQRDVHLAAQMATVAATIANGGRRMGPFGQSSDKGRVVKRFEGGDFGEVIPEDVAANLRQMVGVVQNGTGQGAQIPGTEVAGKTGTAQHARGRNCTPGSSASLLGRPADRRRRGGGGGRDAGARPPAAAPPPPSPSACGHLPRGRGLNRALLGNRYRLGERIADGGMGSVYRAVDDNLGRSSRVKVLRRGAGRRAGPPGAVPARPAMAAAVSHPGVAGVYD